MINFDKNATTGTDEEVWNIMKEYAVYKYGNPSSLYPFGIESRKAIERSREIIANIIHCDPDEIYFVSSGTMADNWIIRSFCHECGKFVTSPIEHHAILNMAKSISNLDVAYLPVDTDGVVQADNQIIQNADLVSVMYVNNEIGSIQPIKQIGKICRDYDIPFHTDAVQAFGKLPINVETQCIDFLSASAHKFHGAKGIGFLYVRNKYKDIIKPIFYGGEQQHGLIAGTENVPGIVGMAYAAQKAYDTLIENNQKIVELSTHFKYCLYQYFPKIIINNSAKGMVNCLSVSFAKYDIRGEELLAFLYENDICASTGSACNSASNEPSHVLKALGLTDKEINSTIRFSMDQDNTVNEIHQVIQVLIKGVELLSHR